MMVALALLGNETRPCVPGLARKPLPVMVTGLPMPPMLGVMPVICGDGTVKSIFALLATPPSVTPMGPVMASAGTVATICVSDQLTIVATAGPLFAEVAVKANALVPWAAPKPLPLICTCVPAGPLLGEIPAICGLGSVNSTSGLLEILFTKTRTGPVTVPAGTVATTWASL